MADRIADGKGPGRGAPSALYLGVALVGSAAAAASFRAAGRALVGGDVGPG